jgi:Na+/H+-dicarboxylate symporter
LTSPWRKRVSGGGLFALSMLAATVLGVLAGWACQQDLSTQRAASVAADLSIVTNIFLRLIKMIVAPLVFTTLVSAIARMRGAAEIGRIGIKTLAWFIGASCLSLVLGLCMAHGLQPGSALHLVAPATSASTVSADAAGLSLAQFVDHLVPHSIIGAMADNEILQIVVCALLIGMAAAALKERADPLVELMEAVAGVMFKVTDMVMHIAPLAIFAALASTIAVHGIGLLGTYARFVGGFYLSLGILWLLLWVAASLVIGRRSVRLLAGIRSTVLLAFATSSSEAAYPKLLEQLVDFGIPRRIASFVLPLGYSFNLDGAMVYCTFAILFVAQAYGIALSLPQQLALCGVLLVSSKGLAGVPRAAIMVIAVTLPYFHLPASGLALVLAVDHILDMGRSATNIIGNAVAAAVMAEWEKHGDHVPPDAPAPTPDLLSP